MKIRHLIAATLALVAILWFQGARADVLDDLKAEGVVKLYHDYRAGHLQDLSGNANHGTGTDIAWTNDGVSFPASTSLITVADSAELQLTTGALVVLGKFYAPTDYNMLVCKEDAGGNNYRFYTYGAPQQMMFFDGTAARQVAATIDGVSCMGVNFANGATNEGYVGGISTGVYSATSAVSVDDAPITIGNLYTNGYPVEGTLGSALIINRPLTATEHAQVCAALQSYRYPTMPRAVAQGSYGVELVTNGDFEIGVTTGWSAGHGATLTAESGNAMAGSYVIRVAIAADYAYARQSMMTAGKTYRITADARGDGTSPPSIRDDGVSFWAGTTSTAWQSVDVVHTATSAHLDLFKTVNGGAYTEFDNISVKEVESPEIQFKTEWGAKEGGNLGGDENLPGTDLWVNSGNMGITVETINGSAVKAVTCAAGGGFQVHAREIEGNPFEDAYGTFEFWFSKAAGTTFIAHFIADDLAGTNGYSFRVSATEVVTLVQNGTGNLFATTAAYVTADTWYQVRITRRQSDGMFTVYIDGVLVTADSGANPVAQNTVKASTYIVFDVGTGDHVGVSDLAGNYSLWKGQGVIAP